MCAAVTEGSYRSIFQVHGFRQEVNSNCGLVWGKKITQDEHHFKYSKKKKTEINDINGYQLKKKHSG